MKELQPIQRDKTEVVAKRHVKDEFSLIASLNPKKGQTLFEINKKTGTIKPAQFETASITFAETGKTKVVKKVITKPDCFYTCAVNENNALRHYTRMFTKK